jgi:hypothetical protein
MRPKGKDIELAVQYVLHDMKLLLANSIWLLAWVVRYQQYRARAVAQHSLGGSPECAEFEKGPMLRPEHNQINVLLPSEEDDLFCGISL